MKVLITGAGGYLGAIVAKYLAEEKGCSVTLFDRLRKPLPQALSSFRVIKGDVTIFSDLENCFSKNSFAAVIHLAGLRSVAESISNPELYFAVNTEGSKNVIEAAKRAGVGRLIFASTSEVYGNARYLPIDEKHPLKPLSPYGESKERAEAFFGEGVVLRLANVAGACPVWGLGDISEPSYYLITNAIKGALGIRPFSFTCGRVNTPDGTPIRDFVHVLDVAEAFWLSLSVPVGIYNIGSGVGYSALEIVNKVKEVTGANFETSVGEARPGEASAKFLDIKKAKKDLGWEPHHNLNDMVKSSYDFYSAFYSRGGIKPHKQYYGK